MIRLRRRHLHPNVRETVRFLLSLALVGALIGAGAAVLGGGIFIATCWLRFPA